VPSRQGARRTEEDRFNLEVLLRTKLRAPRP
jgi:hypothetical protein